MKTFKTAKGTELPIMDIKGKDYLQAAPRIFWMREEHSDWGIETEFLALGEKAAVCRATIRDGSGKILAQATSAETAQGFESFVEKAETCAVSRAASFCGYGTLMAQELEEHGKLAESPQDPKRRVVPLQSIPKGVVPVQSVPNDPGAYVVKVGKKYLGARLDKIGPHDALSYAKYLRDSSKEAGKPLTGDWLEAVTAIDAFVASREASGSK